MTRGKHALIDEADAEVVSRYNWHVRISVASPWLMYAQRAVLGSDGRKGVLSLHHFLWTHWGLPATPQIDHENGDGLDCRRANLRAATSNQNARNVDKRNNNTSGYKGVSFHKQSRRYTAQITVNRRVRYIGMFADPVAAARAYDTAAVAEFGEFARPNFPAAAA